jgi:hypothetical protein
MRLFAAAPICLFVLFCLDQEFWQGQYTDRVLHLAQSIRHAFGF